MNASTLLDSTTTRLARTGLSGPASESLSRIGAAALLFGGTLGATSSLHAGGGAYNYGNLHFGTVASLTIDIDGSWAAGLGRPISAVDFASSAGPYSSLSGGVNATASTNGYDYSAEGLTAIADPSNYFDRLSARALFGYQYSGQTDPYPTTKNGYAEYVLNITTAAKIEFNHASASVTLDGNSIASGATLAVGTRTVRFTFNNVAQPGNQFIAFSANLVPIAVSVPGGGLAGLAAAALAVRRRRRRG